MFWKIFFSNKFGFILETSLFSYWWTAKSLDNAPYTSLKRKRQKTQTKLQSKRKICEILKQQEEQYKVIQNFQMPQKEQYKLLQIHNNTSAFKQWFQTKLTKGVLFTSELYTYKVKQN